MVEPSLAELVPYIDWSPFFHAWELRGRFPAILEDEVIGPQAKELYEDARQLLGGVTNGPYYEMKKNAQGRVLEPDKLLRISYLIGIFKALNILHAQKLADEWVRLPNTNLIFGGMTPLAYMVRGGVPAIQTVRRLLDARRGGV